MDPTLACLLQPAEYTARRIEVGKEIFAHVDTVEELADGYAYRLPGTPDWTTRLAEFVNFERDCCPFLTFELSFEPEHGAIWLRMRGSEAIKQFVVAEMSGYADPDAAAADDCNCPPGCCQPMMPTLQARPTA